MTHSELTKDKLQSLIGKKIQWASPCDNANIGHYGYGQCGGICTIKEIDHSARRPITSHITHDGDDIRFAFTENYTFTPGALCYGDSDREIMFKVLENEN